MKIWVISDLHLSFGAAGKEMSVFGAAWEDFEAKVEKEWRACVQKDDLVLIPGDISWAMTLENALVDLNWIDRLPGRKIIIKGNHDYWWISKAKVQAILPPSIQIIHRDSIIIDDVIIGGARLWDTDEFRFGSDEIAYKENPRQKIFSEEETAAKKVLDRKIFEKEIGNLEASLATFPKRDFFRIAMTHYPPLGKDLAPSRASTILEKHKVDVCVFGHLHAIKPGINLYDRTARGVKYVLASCDYTNFTPLLIRG